MTTSWRKCLKGIDWKLVLNQFCCIASPLHLTASWKMQLYYTQGCDVVVGSSSSRTLLATPLIRRKSLADLVIKTRQISQRTGNPVYFVKNDKCKGKEHVSELTKSAIDLNLSASPFYNPRVVKKLLENYRDTLWHEEWVNSGV